MKSRDDRLPEIYAQHTWHNDRIISLLSAVLMRRLHQEFDGVIRDRFPSALENHSAVGIFERRVNPGIIFVKDKENQNLTQFLQHQMQSSMTPLFARELLLERSYSRDTMALDEMFRLIETDSQVVVVATSGACNWLFSYLLAKQTAARIPTSLRGLLAFFPESHSALPVLDIPTLCIVGNKQGSVSRSSALNPNLITVVIDSPEKLSTTPEGSLWVARTALKYLSAVLINAANRPARNNASRL